MLMHRGAARAPRRAGSALGRDLSFVGCDDVADRASCTTRRSPSCAATSGRSASRAAELLLADLEPSAGDGSEAPREIVLPTEFVPRASCAPVN